MTEVYLTIFFISVLLIFLGSGVWVGISMIGVSTIGMIMFTSNPVGDAMATTMWSMGSSWSLTALPLFVWMGEILLGLDCQKICSRVYHLGYQNYLEA